VHLCRFQAINILKAHGKSAKESSLLMGYALNTGRAAQGMPRRVGPARIACLDFDLTKTKMQFGVQVLVTDPKELEKIRARYASALMHCTVLYCTVLYSTVHGTPLRTMYCKLCEGSPYCWVLVVLQGAERPTDIVCLSVGDGVVLVLWVQGE